MGIFGRSFSRAQSSVNPRDIIELPNDDRPISRTEQVKPEHAVVSPEAVTNIGMAMASPDVVRESPLHQSKPTPKPQAAKVSTLTRTLSTRFRRNRVLSRNVDTLAACANRGPSSNCDTSDPKVIPDPQEISSGLQLQLDRMPSTRGSEVLRDPARSTIVSPKRLTSRLKSTESLRGLSPPEAVIEEKRFTFETSHPQVHEHGGRRLPQRLRRESAVSINQKHRSRLSLIGRTMSLSRLHSRSKFERAPSHKAEKSERSGLKSDPPVAGIEKDTNSGCASSGLSRGAESNLGEDDGTDNDRKESVRPRASELYSFNDGTNPSLGKQEQRQRFTLFDRSFSHSSPSHGDVSRGLRPSWSFHRLHSSNSFASGSPRSPQILQRFKSLGRFSRSRSTASTPAAFGTDSEDRQNSREKQSLVEEPISRGKTGSYLHTGVQEVVQILSRESRDSTVNSELAGNDENQTPNHEEVEYQDVRNFNLQPHYDSESALGLMNRTSDTRLVATDSDLTPQYVGANLTATNGSAKKKKMCPPEADLQTARDLSELMVKADTLRATSWHKTPAQCASLQSNVTTCGTGHVHPELSGLSEGKDCARTGKVDRQFSTGRNGERSPDRSVGSRRPAAVEWDGGNIDVSDRPHRPAPIHMHEEKKRPLPLELSTGSRRPPSLSVSQTMNLEESFEDEEERVFGSTGDFSGAGFRITAQGMVDTQLRVTRKDSENCSFDGGSPPSSPFVIIRDLTEFRKGRALGAGVSGRVYLATHKPTGKLMAMKVVNVYDEAKRNQLLKELETLTTHVSRFLVRFYGAFYDGSGGVHIALEYMDRGCLASIVKQCGPVPEAIACMIAYDCLRGLRFLHRYRVIHRDFKTANILLSRRLCQAKLADFGLARDVNAGVSLVDTFVGTMAYMSPERLRGVKYTYASDIWALGVSVAECLLGKYPFDKPATFFDFIDSKAKKNMLNVRGRKFSRPAKHFIKVCTALNAEQRPTAEELLDHPWIATAKRRDTKLFAMWLDLVASPKKLATDNGEEASAFRHD